MIIDDIHLRNVTIDELVHQRELARIAKEWKVSDAIRDELAQRGSFVVDTPSGQEVHHTPGWAKESWVGKMEYDRRTNADFDAWLFTMRSKGPDGAVDRLLKSVLKKP